MNKTILKTNYYYEFKPFYDSLPEILTAPKKFIEKVNDRIMMEKDIVEGNKPFSKEEAFGLVCKFIEEKKDSRNVIWFKDDEGGLCKVSTRLVSAGWCVNVDGFNSSDEWSSGFRSFFRNSNNSDTSSLESRIKSLESQMESLRKIINIK